MILSYRQLELSLSLYLGIHPDRIGTFRARIKQFQRLQFPSGVNVGRGTKMTYSGEHLFKLAAAFHLVQMGQPAMTAANLVDQNWDSFAAGFGLAIRNEFYEWPISKDSANLSIYLRIALNTLAPLSGNSEEHLLTGIVHVEHGEMFREALEDEPEREANSFLVLCASHIMRGLLYACAQAKVDEPFQDTEFEDWHERESRYKWWNYGEISKNMNIPND